MSAIPDYGAMMDAEAAAAPGVSADPVTPFINEASPAAKAPTGIPDYGAMMDQEAAGAARLGYHVAQGTDPDQYARAKQLARELGVPTQTALADAEALQRKRAAGEIDFDKIAREQPQTANLLSDPERAKIAHDDVPGLQATETTAKGWGQSFADAPAELIKGLGGSFNRSAGSVNLLLGAVPTVYDKAASLLTGRVHTSASDAWFGHMVEPVVARQAQFEPDANAAFPEKLASTLGSLAGTLSQITLSGTTAAPATPAALGVPAMQEVVGGAVQHSTKAMLAPAAVEATDTARQVYDATGGDAGAAIRAAEAKYATTSAMGVLPLSAPGGAFARIGSGAVSGVAGGEAGRVVNNAVLPDQMQTPLSAEDLALQAVTGSVLAIGGPRGANAARLHAARVESAKRASQGAALLGQLNKLAAASKVRARDPAQAQAFFQSVLDEGRDSVWITPKALAESGLSARIIAEIPGVAEQVRTAADIQHDIRLPVADLMARLAGPELEQGILLHVSTEPGGFTAKTAEAYYQTGAAAELQAEVARVLGDDAAAVPFKASAEKVKAAILADLAEAGRHPGAHDVYATLVSQFYAVQAARLGTTPEALYHDYPIRVAARSGTGEAFGQDATAPRGSFTPDTLTITLHQGADLSSFLHETGHAFLELQTQLASRIAREADGFGGALSAGERELIADTHALLRWFGVRDLDTWHAMPFEERRSHHEQFARGFEVYLHEGRAPSLELAGVFQRFRAYLLGVYRNLLDTNLDAQGKRQGLGVGLKVELTDEVRGVMDRMIASGDQIQAAEQGRALMPLFARADQAGMTVDEFRDYQALGIDATNTAIEDLQARGVRDLQWIERARGRMVRQLLREAAGLRAQAQMDARRELLSQPIYQAWQFLTNRIGADDMLPAAVARADYLAARKAWNADLATWEAQALDEAKQAAWESSVEGQTRYRRKATLERAQCRVAQREAGAIAADLDARRAAWKAAHPAPVESGQAPKINPRALGAGRINRAALSDLLTDIARDPADSGRILAALDAAKMITNKGGLHPDVVGDLVPGLHSGEELVRALADATPLQEALTARTDALMLERHGDLATPAALAEAADRAIFNDVRARLVTVEANALAKATGRPQILTRAAQEFAGQMVAKLRVRDIRPDLYAAGAARAGKAAAKASQDGDLATAAAEKRNQVILVHATKAAYQAKTEAEGVRRKLSKFARAADDRLKGIYDLDLVNAVRAIVGQYGIAPGKAESASAYVSRLKDYAPDTHASIIEQVQAAEANARPFRDLTVDDVRALKDVADDLMHLAKQSHRIEVDGALMSRKAIEAKLLERLTAKGIPEHMPGETSAVTPAEARLARFQEAKAFLSLVEFWAMRMDGTMADIGPFRRYIFNLVKGRADAYRADQARVMTDLKGLLDGIAPTLKPILIHSPELNYTFGKDKSGAGMNEVVHALLHTGNASNKRKLLLGRGWAEQGADGTLDTSRWDAFVARMIAEGKITQAHYDFAQGVWDLNEGMKPLAQKAHRDVFGRYFDEITAEPVPTPFGEYRGGYVPAQVDTRIVKDLALKKLVEEENANLAFAMPSTPRGFTKGRVEYNRPLLLDLRALPQHINQVLLFAHLEVPIRGVNRLLKGIGEPLNRVDPAAINGMLTPWLAVTARQQVVTPVSADAGISRIATMLRQRAGAAAMTGNLLNGFQQLFTGFPMAARRVGWGPLLKATGHYMRNPAAMVRAVSAASAYMDGRLNDLVHSMSDDIHEILINPGRLERAQDWTMRHSYFFQRGVDLVMTPITWTAAYNKARGEGKSTADATALADSTVRTSQGSFLPEDVARVATGTAWWRAATQFSDYFTMWRESIETELVTADRRGGPAANAGRKAEILLMAFLVPAVVGELVAQGFRGGPADEDLDGAIWDDWLKQVFVVGPLKNAAAMIPILGPSLVAGANAFNDKPYDDRMATSPTVGMIESSVKGVVALPKLLTPEELTLRNVRDMGTLVSMALGLPGTIISRPLGYLVGVENDRIRPTSNVRSRVNRRSVPGAVRCARSAPTADRGRPAGRPHSPPRRAHRA